MENIKYHTNEEDEKKLKVSDDIKKTVSNKKQKKQKKQKKSPASGEKFRSTDGVIDHKKEENLSFGKPGRTDYLFLQKVKEHNDTSNSNESTDIVLPDNTDSTYKSINVYKTIIMDSEKELLFVDEQIVVSKKITEDYYHNLVKELKSFDPNSSEAIEVSSGLIFINELKDNLSHGKFIDDELLQDVTDSVASDLGLDSEKEVEFADDAVNTDVIPNTQNLIITSKKNNDLSTSRSTPVQIKQNSDGGGISEPPDAFVGGEGSSYSRPSLTPIKSGFDIIQSGSEDRSYNYIRDPIKYKRGADLLVGGIVGYLIGRRSGRIKAETRFEPVQKTFEKQIKDLHQKIYLHENKIRILTSENLAREGKDKRLNITEKVNKKTRKILDSYKKEPPKISTVIESDFVHDTIKSRGKDIANDKQVWLMKRESKLASAILAKIESLPGNSKANVQKMPTPDLLKVESSLQVNGVTAKQIFEQNHLNTYELRRIVASSFADSGSAEKIGIMHLAKRSKEIGRENINSNFLFSKRSKNHYDKASSLDEVTDINLVDHDAILTNSKITNYSTDNESIVRSDTIKIVVSIFAFGAVAMILLKLFF